MFVVNEKKMTNIFLFSIHSSLNQKKQNVDNTYSSPIKLKSLEIIFISERNERTYGIDFHSFVHYFFVVVVVNESSVCFCV